MDHARVTSAAAAAAAAAAVASAAALPLLLGVCDLPGMLYGSHAKAVISPGGDVPCVRGACCVM